MINERGFFEKSRDAFETFTETKREEIFSSFVRRLSIIKIEREKKEF